MTRILFLGFGFGIVVGICWGYIIGYHHRNRQLRLGKNEQS